MSPGDETEFNPFILLARRWRVLLISGLIALAASVTYALLAPKWYQARLSVVPAGQSIGLANPLLGKMKDVPEQLEFAMGASSEAYRIAAVLRSTSVTDMVIEEFDLVSRYDQPNLDRTRERLWELCSTGVDRKADLVTLTCEDKDPKQVKAIVEYFGEVGNKVFRRVTASSAREERRFLEERVAEARKTVDDASRRLREFQETHKVVDLGEQSKAVISAIAKLEGQLLSKQLELSYLDDFSAHDEATVAQLRRQISIMKSKLRSLQEERTDRGTTPKPKKKKAHDKDDADIFPPAMSMPRLRFELEQLFREQQIQETVFLMLTMRFEAAKVKEARDTATFQILDSPTLPTHKVRPRRRLIVALGLLGGLLLGAAWILVPPWWRRRMSTLD